VRDPHREAIDHHERVVAQLSQSLAQMLRLLEHAPVRWPLTTMLLDALAHLIICRPGSNDDCYIATAFERQPCR